MWKNDGAIDEINLDRATLDCAKMHGKYLEMYSHGKLILRKREAAHNILSQNKWLYYSGKMTKSQIDSHGWPYDPFNGCSKPMKSEVYKWVDVDPDIVNSKLALEVHISTVETLREILDNIKWRHSAIKNILDYRKFCAGN